MGREGRKGEGRKREERGGEGREGEERGGKKTGKKEERPQINHMESYRIEMPLLSGPKLGRGARPLYFHVD